MAKSGKKKSGFHKDISSVLKGVPIPQGVRNWRPPDRSDTDRTDDSPSSVVSNVSSVFKGVLIEPDYSNQPAEPQPRNEDAKAPPADAPEDRRTSRSTLIRKLDCPEDFSNKAEQVTKPAPANRVAHYHDPVIKKATPSVAEQLQGKSLASRKGLSKKGRKALVLSAPALIVIIILIYRYCIRSAPQETEASASRVPPPVSAPAISSPEVRNDVDWQVPERLPASVMNFLKGAEEETEQKKQGREPAKGKREIDLRAILFSVQKPSAVIGGRILYVGDKVSDATITNIAKDSVEFEKDGKTWTQKLRK